MRAFAPFTKPYPWKRRKYDVRDIIKGIYNVSFSDFSGSKP
jgi:hypothetical protein